MTAKSQIIPVQAKLYGMEALYRACYAFLDRAYIRLEGDPVGTVKVSLKPKNGSRGAGGVALAGEFENELLHQALRAKISATNSTIREYIVARALASAQGAVSTVAGGVEAPGRDGSPSNPSPGAGEGGGGEAQEESVLDEDLEKEIEALLAEVEKEGGEDPLNIAVPWEEQGGEKSASNTRKNDKKAKGRAKEKKAGKSRKTGSKVKV